VLNAVISPWFTMRSLQEDSFSSSSNCCNISYRTAD